MSLIVVARAQAALETLAQELRAAHKVPVTVLAADLSLPESIARLQQAIGEQQLSVDLLVNNAGFKTYGRFESLPPDVEQAEVMVNVAAVVGLSRAFLPDMLARRAGAIINVASITSFQPVPYMAVYAATKAFVLSFSMSLAEEMRGRGVQIVTLCPGPTSTELFIRSKSTEVIRGSFHTPEQVVATALHALDRGRNLIVAGWKNTLLTYCSSLLPKAFTAMMAGRQVRPK